MIAGTHLPYAGAEYLLNVTDADVGRNGEVCYVETDSQVQTNSETWWAAAGTPRCTGTGYTPLTVLATKVGVGPWGQVCWVLDGGAGPMCGRGGEYVWGNGVSTSDVAVGVSDWAERVCTIETESIVSCGGPDGFEWGSVAATDVFIGMSAICGIAEVGVDCTWYCDGWASCGAGPFFVPGGIEVAELRVPNGGFAALYVLKANGEVERFCSYGLCGGGEPQTASGVDHVDSYDDGDHLAYCRQLGQTIACEYFSGSSGGHGTATFNGYGEPALVKDLHVGVIRSSFGPPQVKACQLTTVARLYCTTGTIQWG